MRLARLPRLVRLLLVAGVLALGCWPGANVARAASTEEVTVTSPPQQTGDYRLGPGDKLRLIVYGEDDLGGTFDVDGAGNVSLPLIGQVQVAGRSARDVENIVTADFADGFLKQPRVNIEIVQYRPFYVIGEVNKPGQYPYVSDMSVLNAVALAGGYTEKAVESGVYIRRNGETKESYYDADGATKIYPGDVVRVPVSTFWEVLSAAGPITGIAYGLRNGIF